MTRGRPSSIKRHSSRSSSWRCAGYSAAILCVAAGIPGGRFVDGTHHLVRQLGTIAGSKCYEVATGHVVDCHPLKDRHRAALERLEISDAIIRGDLSPPLTATGRASDAP